MTEVLLAGGVDPTIGTVCLLRFAKTTRNKPIFKILWYFCKLQPPLDICARRNYPLPAAVCLKYGVPGAGEALVRAADVGNPAVVKVILQHWTGEDDMV